MTRYRPLELGVSGEGEGLYFPKETIVSCGGAAQMVVFCSVSQVLMDWLMLGDSGLIFLYRMHASDLKSCLTSFIGLDCAEPACISILSRVFVTCVKHGFTMVLIFLI